MAVDRHHGILRPCCWNQDPDWSLNSSIDQYWHSKTLQRIRTNMLKGQRDSSCASCWQQEDQQHMSMRQSVMQSRQLTIDTIANPRLTQVKLITGSTCNLACMMCFSTVSTTYANLWSERHDWSMPVAKRKPLMYDHDMEDYIRSHADEIHFIEALGGEPLFEKKFLQLLEHLVQIGAHEHITLFIVTNGTLSTDPIICLLKKFKKTVLAVSVDGVGPANEYQRWPSKWIDVDQNLAMWNEHFDISILPTVTVLNILHLPDLTEYCRQRNYTINNYNLVSQWPELSPHNLPYELRTGVSTQFRCWVNQEPNTDAALSFIRQWDKQRGISIGDYLPEWRSYMTNGS